jgi:hypothetical protein
VEGNQTIRDARDLEGRAVAAVSQERRDLGGRSGLDCLGSRDCERAGLVAARDPARALGRVEASGFGGAEGFVAELRVSDVRDPDRKEELLRDLEGDQAMVGKNGMGN